MIIKTLNNKGLHIIHDDGLMFSLQWGTGNYCDNYSLSTIGLTDKPDTKSSNCEVAVINKQGDWITEKYFDTNGDQVAGYVPIKEALEVAVNRTKLKNIPIKKALKECLNKESL